MNSMCGLSSMVSLETVTMFVCSLSILVLCFRLYDTERKLHQMHDDMNDINDFVKEMAIKNRDELNRLDSKLKTIEMNCNQRCLNKEIKDSCNLNNTQGWIPIDLTFNRSSLYDELFISSNNTEIRNRYLKGWTKSPKTGFKRYEGVLGSRCVPRNESLQFEIEYAFKIVKRLNQSDLVFEIGFSEMEKLLHEDFVHVGGESTGSWSFHVAVDGEGNLISLFAQNKTDDVIVERNFSSKDVATFKRGIFKVLIDRKKGEISLISNERLQVYQFQNVSSENDICCAFGTFNKQWIVTSLKLTNASVCNHI